MTLKPLTEEDIQELPMAVLIDIANHNIKGLYKKCFVLCREVDE